METVNEGFAVVQPGRNGFVFVSVQFHSNGLQRLDIEDVVGVIQRRFFIIERRETHSFEMATISLLASHHNPHASPLGHVDRFNDPGNFVHETDGTCNVVENFDIFDQLPWHRHVFQQLQYSMRHVFQCAKIHSLVVTELHVCHVSMISDDLADMFRRHVIFLRVNKPKLPLF